MAYLDILKKTNFWGERTTYSGKYRAIYVDQLVAQAKNQNISIVKGVRRSGKSTILTQVIKQLIDNGVKPENTLIVNFEDPRLSELKASNNLFSLIEEFNDIADNRSRLYLFLDEIQNVQDWELILRTIRDQEPNLKLFITGSSAELLSREFGSKLSGRYISTEIFPLSYREKKEMKLPQGLDNYLNVGGFPDISISTPANQRAQLLRDYYDSILLRDILIRYGIRNEFKLSRMSARLFANISNQASSYKLSQELGLSANTVLQYFGYIQDAYLGFFVPQFFHSVRKQEYNPKKFYAIDTGLQAAVAHKVIDDYGKLFENLVFLELRRRFKEIYYWEQEKEVDFVIKQGADVTHLVNACVDIKQDATEERELEGLKLAMHQFGLRHSYLVVMKLNKTETISTEVGEIIIQPFSEFAK